jgi:hypothetical protein
MSQTALILVNAGQWKVVGLALQVVGYGTTPHVDLNLCTRIRLFNSSFGLFFGAVSVWVSCAPRSSSTSSRPNSEDGSRVTFTPGP